MIKYLLSEQSFVNIDDLEQNEKVLYAEGGICQYER